MKENPNPTSPPPGSLPAANGSSGDHIEQFRLRLQKLSLEWRRNGLPSLQGLETTADRLEMEKKELAVEGIWAKKPLMVTATIDDGLGQGLMTIHRYGRIIGVDIHHLGLLQQPKAIIAACRQLRPQFLGLTVLQLDSDDDLARIGSHLPCGTRLIAGGPVFQFDTDMALRCGVDKVCPDVAHFIDYMCRQA